MLNKHTKYPSKSFSEFKKLNSLKKLVFGDLNTLKYMLGEFKKLNSLKKLVFGDLNTLKYMLGYLHDKLICQQFYKYNE